MESHVREGQNKKAAAFEGQDDASSCMNLHHSPEWA